MSVALTVDPALGARITSLVGAGREWLWSRPDAARSRVVPGVRFVDVGGIEECYPTVAGSPDHGDVWSRPWRAVGDRTYVCRTDDSLICRRHSTSASGVRLDYRLIAPPGHRFVWALHILIRPERTVRIVPQQGAIVRRWPLGFAEAAVEEQWPARIAGRRFDDLTVDDATATFAVLARAKRIEARAGGAVLRIDLAVEQQPGSIGLWRNLGGYAWDGGQPYRSLGIEPMLGAHPDLGLAGPGETAVVPDAGTLRWSVRLRFGRRVDGAGEAQGGCSCTPTADSADVSSTDSGPTS